MKKIISVLALVSLLTGATLFATRVKPLNLLQMVELSDRIFRGVCVDVTLRDEPRTGLRVREYTFEVRRALKGVQKGQRVVFRQMQGGEGSGLDIPGLPRYKKGADVLIFLHGDSKLGLTSPVGMQQGLFHLREMDAGNVGVLNSVDNRNLFHNLELRHTRASGLAGREVEVLKNGGVISLDEFSAIVGKFDRYQRLSKEKSAQ